MSDKTAIETRWAIAKGEYSDYQVLAVFESESDARAWLHFIEPNEHARARGAYIEEIVFVPAGIGPHARTLATCVQDLYVDGKHDKAHRFSDTRPAIHWALVEPPPQRPTVRWIRLTDGQETVGYRCVVEASSTEAVKKAHADHVRQFTADPEVFSEKELDVWPAPRYSAGTARDSWQSLHGQDLLP